MMGWISKIVDGLFQADAASKASQAQMDASNTSLATGKNIYDTSKANFEPYRQGGTQDYSQMRDKYYAGQFDPQKMNYNAPQYQQETFNYEQDPGYQFRLNQGLGQVGQEAANQGSSLSGATLKALSKYNQDFASNEYGNAYNRFNTNRAFNRGNFENDRTFGYGSALNAYNQDVSRTGNNWDRMSQMSNYGTDATRNLASLGSSYTDFQNGALGDYGNAQAAGYMGQGQGNSKAVQGIGEMFQSMFTRGSGK